MRLILDVDPGSRPLSGTLHDGSQSPVAFVGLLDLVSLIEAIIDAAAKREEYPSAPT